MNRQIQPTESETAFSVSLDELVVALSEALGLVGGKIVNHGKRVAFLALSLAQELGLPQEDLNDLRVAALLHDAGVSRTSIYQKLKQLEWEGAEAHCAVGAELLSDFPPFHRPADIIRSHHQKWDRITRSETDGQTAVLSNLIYLADRIDALVDWNTELILNRNRILGQISELSGTYFNPDAVAALKKKSLVEVFWLSLYPRHLSSALESLSPNSELVLNLTDFETLASVFARIVDNKSPFTQDHSHGVARLCQFFGNRMNLEPVTVQKLRISGLVHDLGKLSIPDEILEKPSALSPDEFEIVKRHPFETYYILSGSQALAEIRDWASFHHEKADGSGYPFHLTGRQMGLEHLIVMFSDIIQALVQERPYRAGLGQDQVLDILMHLATQQSALQPLVDEVRKDYELVSVIAGVPDK